MPQLNVGTIVHTGERKNCSFRTPSIKKTDITK